MPTPDKATDNTRIAIEFLTLWLEPDRNAAADHISGVLDEVGEQGVPGIVAGLLNLNMVLAMQLAKAKGAEPANYIAWIGNHLREMSPQLPDSREG